MPRDLELAFVNFAKRRQGDLVLLGLGVLLGVVFNWETVEILLFVIFLWSLLRPIPSRVLAIPALVFLILTPILLAFDRETRAEEFAVYAYYFLAMAVIRGIIEVRNEK